MFKRQDEIDLLRGNYQTALDAWNDEISLRQKVEADNADLRRQWDEVVGLLAQAGFVGHHPRGAVKLLTESRDDLRRQLAEANHRLTVMTDSALKQHMDAEQVRRQLAEAQSESANRFGLLAEARAEANRQHLYSKRIGAHNKEVSAERDALASALEEARNLLHDAIDKVPEGYEILRDRMDKARWGSNDSAHHAERVRLMRAVVEAARALHPEPYTVHSDRKAYERFDAALAALDAHERKEQAE